MHRYPKFKSVHLLWQQLIFITIIFLLITTTGCQRTKPLSLGPGESIRGSFRVEGSGPFHIGDSIPIVLTIEAKPGIIYQLPEFSNPIPGGLELKQKLPSRTEKFPGGSRQSTRYLFMGWQVGQYTIPGTKLVFEGPSNTNGTLQLNPLNIALCSVLPKGKSETELLALDIKGIKYPLGLPPRYALLKWFLLGALVLGLSFLLFRLYLRFVLKPETTLDEQLLEPAHIIALRRLEYLKGTTLMEQGDYKTFYSELSECIREYMENRYFIRALEMTTEEFLARLTSEAYLNKEHQSTIKKFLHQSDLVKFAKQLPPVEEAGQALVDIEQLVVATKEEPLATVTNQASPDETIG